MSDNTNNGFPVPEEPRTREEQYLSAIAGVTSSSDIPEKPRTRIEAYLDKIVENGEGGGGGGGFTPTQEQLDAMNSGITSEDVEQISTNQNNISSCKEFTDNATIDSDRKLYISATEPTGDIPQGSTWIDGKTIKTYGRTDNYFDEKYTGISDNPNNIVYQPINVGDGDFTMSTTCPNVPGVNALLFFIGGNVDTGASSANNGVINNQSRTVTSINGYVTVAYRGSSAVTPVDYETIVNSGTTAESYVPYLAWQ